MIGRIKIEYDMSLACAGVCMLVEGRISLEVNREISHRVCNAFFYYFCVNGI